MLIVYFLQLKIFRHIRCVDISIAKILVQRICNFTIQYNLPMVSTLLLPSFIHVFLFVFLSFSLCVFYLEHCPPLSHALRTLRRLTYTNNINTHFYSYYFKKHSVVFASSFLFFVFFFISVFAGERVFIIFLVLFYFIGGIRL